LVFALHSLRGIVESSVENLKFVRPRIFESRTADGWMNGNPGVPGATLTFVERNSFPLRARKIGNGETECVPMRVSPTAFAEECLHDWALGY
jgi:hypothetical protein